jgi:tRNA-dihydrouridine synthase B
MTPLTIGSCTFQNRIFIAPLAGISDFPFRQMALKYKPGCLFCEMVSIEALVRADRDTYSMLEFSPDQHPIGAQLVGANPKKARTAAKIIEDLGFDLVDLNCGCPVNKVVGDGGGSALLKTPRAIGDIIKEMKDATKIPVTVKVRAGWDEKSVHIEELVQIAEEAGASIITVHGRTRKQAYSGKVNLEWISRAKKAARKILVFGNGDIFSPQKAKEMLEATGVDGILLARGTFGAPWLIEDIQLLLQEKALPRRSLLASRDELLRHFEYVFSHFPEKKALLDMRRIGSWYIKRLRGTKLFRQTLVKCTSKEEIYTLICSFPFEEEPLHDADEFPPEKADAYPDGQVENAGDESCL